MPYFAHPYHDGVVGENGDTVQPIYDRPLDDGIVISTKSCECEVLQKEDLETSEEKENEVLLTDPVFSTQYRICLMDNEFPVIGTYVDAKITPGFYYRVRRLGRGDYFWNSEPKRLISVGMGYGKRITFEGDQALDSSDFYFYSDTEPEGFAFVPAVPELRRKYLMCDQTDRPVAKVNITSISKNQTQLSSIISGSNIITRILMNFTCDIHMTGRGGLLPLEPSLHGVCLKGVAGMERQGSSRNCAILKMISDIHIPSYGSFHFVPA